MVSLSDYGEVWRKYTGEGKLRGTKGSYPCEFEVGQLHDGTCLFICYITNEKNEDFLFDFQIIDITRHVSFLGISKDGIHVEINTACIISEQDTEYLDFSEVIVFKLHGHIPFTVKSVSKQISSSVWQFSVVNLRFLGTTSSDGSQLDTISFELDRSRVQIIQISDYADVKRRLKRHKGPLVTSKIVMTGDDLTEESATNLVQRICNLLTIAQGTYISWLDMKYICDDGLQRTIHYNHINLPITGYRLIPEFPILTLPNFIVESYPHYLKADEIFNMLGVVQMYADSRGDGFLETTGLLVCSTVEVLSKQMFKYANDNKLEYPFEEKYFKCFKGKKKLQFCIRLSQLVEYYRAPISPDEIKYFVDCRNSLTHELKFLSEIELEEETEEENNKYDDYLFLISILERILLAILKYDNGRYTDIRHFSNITNKDLPREYILTDFHPDTD